MKNRLPYQFAKLFTLANGVTLSVCQVNNEERGCLALEIKTVFIREGEHHEDGTPLATHIRLQIPLGHDSVLMDCATQAFDQDCAERMWSVIEFLDDAHNNDESEEQYTHDSAPDVLRDFTDTLHERAKGFVSRLDDYRERVLN